MLTVRRGQLSDLPAVLELLAQVWEDDYVPDYWADWVVKPEEGIVLVALIDGVVVGTCYVHFLADQQCWFQAMRVHPAHRRAGVGSALTERSLNEARQDRRRVAYLGIDADNPASLSMTARAGFVQISAYQRLHTIICPLPKTGVWRTANPSDSSSILEMMSSLAERSSYPKALFTHWEWQELNAKAVSDAIQRQDLWLWQDGNTQVAAGIDLHGDEVGVFAPAYSKEDDLVAAISALHSVASQQGAKRMELWMPTVAQELPTMIERLGFTIRPDDAYTIWCYDLHKSNQKF